MAHSRPYSPILEQPRHRWLWPALSAGLILLAAGSGFLLRGKREEKPANHAFAVPPVRGRVMIEVLNGTRRQGVARTATRMLRARGLDVVFLGNADTAETATRVIVRRGSPDQAQYVVDVLGAGKIVVEPDTFRRVDLSVILGEDFRPRSGIHP
jgi:LytR cell envelope-related transcriptional attenuator